MVEIEYLKLVTLHFIEVSFSIDNKGDYIQKEQNKDNAQYKPKHSRATCATQNGGLTLGFFTSMLT